mmetsp:Transcript_70749/g.229868  ORF Transcript_70749/g.229868 Transcript_70749/m.229868 type:complete len:291 (+) Transcript_70749:1185-2057(+)
MMMRIRRSVPSASDATAAAASLKTATSSSSQGASTTQTRVTCDGSEFKNPTQMGAAGCFACRHCPASPSPPPASGLTCCPSACSPAPTAVASSASKPARWRKHVSPGWHRLLMSCKADRSCWASSGQVSPESGKEVPLSAKMLTSSMPHSRHQPASFSEPSSKVCLPTPPSSEIPATNTRLVPEPHNALSFEACSFFVPGPRTGLSFRRGCCCCGCSAVAVAACGCMASVTCSRAEGDTGVCMGLSSKPPWEAAPGNLNGCFIIGAALSWLAVGGCKEPPNRPPWSLRLF